MRFAHGVTWRISQRGLVVCSPGSSPLLVEHERAANLPSLLGDAQDPAELAVLLGGTDADRELVDDLMSEEIVLGAGASARRLDERADGGKRVFISRSGIEFNGIDTVARALYRIAWPILRSWTGRIALLVLIVAGAVALFLGPAPGPRVSDHPWIDATIGLVLGFVLVGAHELGHAVALVHYGRSPRSAGFGFYWGSLCFYVDCSDGITLPRRARIINALAGLTVDLVTTAILFLMSHVFAGSVLVMGVCWRLAVNQLIGIAENGLPILEVDGHLALADYLDEPDLAPRSREALSRKLRGISLGGEPRWLAAYGAFSLLGGIALIVATTWIWWLAAGDLVKSLLSGNPIEMMLGLYLVLPLALAVLFSGAGLLLETLARPSRRQTTSSHPNP
ncbi:MAG: hypothetical protein CK431_17890 [Mycobacterium sp.]|nr:MAG: hypothetical protein CK431_17890 [Mycobacterium sp.]